MKQTLAVITLAIAAGLAVHCTSTAAIDKSGVESKADAKTRLSGVREHWVRTKPRVDRAESATESKKLDMTDYFFATFDGELVDYGHETRQCVSNASVP